MKTLNFSKRLLCITIVFSIATFIGVPFVSAEQEEPWDYYVAEGKAYITEYKASIQGHLDIPETLGGAQVVSIGLDAFIGRHDLTSVTLPQSLTTLFGGAFQNTGLTSITIPKNVTRIDLRVFTDCLSLTTITVENENSYYTSIDGVLFTKDLTELKQYPSGKTSSIYTIPQEVKLLRYSAFSSNPYLQKVNISNTVSTIENLAFIDCLNLTDITIPPSVTEIGQDAFGAYYDKESYDWVIIPGFTIHGYVGTYAESYALSENLSFNVLNQKGDNNHDDMVNAKDAMIALQLAVRKGNVTPGLLQVSDVTANTLVNAQDALEILKKAVGKPSCF